MAVTQEWTTKMQTIKEERALASQRGLQWLEDEYVEAVLGIEYRCHDPYYYEYDGYDKDAAAILDLMGVVGSIGGVVSSRWSRIGSISIAGLSSGVPR